MFDQWKNFEIKIEIVNRNKKNLKIKNIKKKFKYINKKIIKIKSINDKSINKSINIKSKII